MAFDATIDSWAPGEPPVGNASVLAPDTGDTVGSITQTPPRSNDFLGNLQAQSDRASSALAGDARKYAETTSVLDQQEASRVERDRGRMEEAFGLERASAADAAALHPWNADKERSERIKGPLENFGSVATIFALAASAFTRTPMNSALTAAGAAMTAMHQNDEEGYKSAYEAWKSNSDLAIKRFNIERNLYEDANKLVTTDTNLWRQKRQALAAQFDDQKRLIMLDNGMDAEVLKADEALTKSAERAIDFKKKFEDIELTRNISQQKMQQWSADHPEPDVSGLPPEEQKKVKAQYALAQYTAKNQAMLDAKHQVAQAGSTARGGLNPNQQQYELIRQKYAGDLDAEGKIADEYAAFIRNQKGGGASARPSMQAENAKSLEDVKTDLKNEHPDWTAGKIDKEANRQIAQSKAVPSGNRVDDLKGQIGRLDRAVEVIDRVETLMKNNKMITGLGGKISRGEEVIGNVVGGSNSTAYNEFKSDIRLLQEWWQRLENNALSQGRPLAASEQRLADIIPGLNMGDTVQHTADQLNRIKKIFAEMRQENAGRIGGESAPAAASPPPSSGKKPWESDPKVGG